MSQTGRNEAPIISIHDLVFNRGARTILSDVDMEIHRGAIVAVMGPSGVGKTTILKLISGQLVPDAGSIVVNGLDVPALSRSELFRLRRSLGFMLQNGALFTDLTVFENVATPLREHTRLDDEAIAGKVMERLEAVGLAGTEELMPHELSGGMARRVALARAVVLDPDILLFDEPLTGLDPIAVSTIISLIRETNDSLGLTSVIVTHDVAQMSRLVDYCYVLAGGTVAAEGRPDDLLESVDPLVNQFMNGRVDGPIPFRYEAPTSSGVAARGALKQ